MFYGLMVNHSQDIKRLKREDELTSMYNTQNIIYTA
jgi:hypothetical protein